MAENESTQQEMTLRQWVERLPKFHRAHREYLALLAASERDQRGAAAQELPAVKSASLSASGNLSPELSSGEPVLSSSGVSDSAQQPAQSAPHPDLLRGIALGIEAAARYCNDENMPILAAILRTLNPADIAAKNPTDDAAGRV